MFIKHIDPHLSSLSYQPTKIFSKSFTPILIHFTKMIILTMSSLVCRIYVDRGEGSVILRIFIGAMQFFAGASIWQPSLVLHLRELQHWLPLLAVMVSAWHANTHDSLWAGVKGNSLWERGEERRRYQQGNFTHSFVLICRRFGLHQV